MTPVYGVAEKRVDAHVMKDSGVQRHLKLVLLGTLVAICAGCIGLSRASKSARGDGAKPAVANEANERNALPSPVKASAPAQAATADGKTSDKPAGVGLSEGEKAKSLALDLAKANPEIKRIKVCHDKKNDEWWLTLYEDAGDHFRLRQYTWSVQQDQPEEFLVLKRLSKSKLETDLTASDPDRVCQAVKYEPGSRVSGVPTPEASPTKSRSDEVSDLPKSPLAVDLEKTPVRNPGTPREPAKAQASPAATARPQGIAQPQTNMAVAPAQAAPKPAASVGGVRKPVSPPDKEAFVQASARSSSAEIGSLRAGAAIQDPIAKPRAPEKTQRQKERIVSESGVFSLAAVRPAANHAALLRESEAAPTLGKSSDSRASGGRKATPLPDVDAALADLERQSSLASPDKRPDKRQEVPTSFVFVYGSEMNHQELLSWLQANNYDSSVILDAAPGVLDEYDLVWNYYSPSRGGGTVNLEPKKNSSVWGLLIEVEDRGLRVFDQKGGHPFYYKRGDNRVPVRRISDGKTMFAWLYRAKPNRSGARNVWPTREYKKRIVEAANFWQFPTHYVEKLESLPTR